MPADRDSSSQGSITVSWATISIGATIIAVAAITGLVILAAVKKVDTLSAIALSLAIVAFMTQIVVFIAQTWSTSRLNAETRSFLSELRTLSQGTESHLARQVDKLTDDLMARASTKGGGTLDRAQVRRDVEDIVLSGARGLPRSEPSARPSLESPFNVNKTAPEQRAALVHRLTTYPTADEGSALRATLSGLAPPALPELVRYAEDALSCYTSPSEAAVPGFPADKPLSPALQGLVDKGLLRDQSHDPGWVTLTNLQQATGRPGWR